MGSQVLAATLSTTSFEALSFIEMFLSSNSIGSSPFRKHGPGPMTPNLEYSRQGEPRQFCAAPEVCQSQNLRLVHRRLPGFRVRDHPPIAARYYLRHGISKMRKNGSLLP